MKISVCVPLILAGLVPAALAAAAGDGPAPMPSGVTGGESAKLEFTYWFYRPSLGWEKVVRQAGPAEIAAASGTRLLLEDSPRLVPLEILPGRNHYDLPAGDEPPWRWKVTPSYEGWSD